MRLFLLLFLSACSGVQGIPVAPRAPVFNPVTDTPITVGQPGYIGSPERAPRGEGKRVLPPTREPGIWAAKETKRLAKVVIFGETIPLPYATDADADLTPADQCRDRIHAESDGDPLLKQAVDTLSSQDRQCLSAVLFFGCIGTFTAGREPQAALAKALDALQRDAFAYMGRVCPEDSAPKDKVKRLAERWLSNRARSGR